MSEWKVKRGDEMFTASDVVMLREWAASRRVQPDDYVLNPVLDKWLYARDVAELAGVFSAHVTREKNESLNRASWGLGGIGLLMCLVFWPAGVVLLIIAVVMSAFYHVNR